MCVHRQVEFLDIDPNVRLLTLSSHEVAENGYKFIGVLRQSFFFGGGLVWFSPVFSLEKVTLPTLENLGKK